jgi:spore protease
LPRNYRDVSEDLDEDDPVLVVGLGNWNATPDALGPRVINKLLVTRHLFTIAPPELRGGLRPVSALAPGVLGITGIETGETIQGVAEKVKPKLIICIDALASRSTERLCTTIQIADTGIHPGSGIGNMRMGITLRLWGYRWWLSACLR